MVFVANVDRQNEFSEFEFLLLREWGIWGIFLFFLDDDIIYAQLIEWYFAIDFLHILSTKNRLSSFTFKCKSISKLLRVAWNFLPIPI